MAFLSIFAFVSLIIATIAVMITLLQLIIRLAGYSQRELAETQRKIIIYKQAQQAIEESLQREKEENKATAAKTRDEALTSASPALKYLITAVEMERDGLKEELRIILETTKQRPIRQFFGNFLWNAGSVIAGYFIGHFFH